MANPAAADNASLPIPDISPEGASVADGMYYNDDMNGPPPNYYDRGLDAQTSGPQRKPRKYIFFKGNGLSSKARIQCVDGPQYRLVADFHNHRSKESSLQLYTEHDTKQSSCIGSLSFPASYNNFNIHTSGSEGSSAPADMLQAKARAGNPHPSEYRLKLPATNHSPATSVVWTKFNHKTFNHTPAFLGYRLTDEVYNTPIATWTLVKGEKHQAVLQWKTPPNDEREEIIVLLSFIGGMARLKLKGKDDMKDWPSGRWGAFWFMAVLGTAAVADF